MEKCGLEADHVAVGGFVFLWQLAKLEGNSDEVNSSTEHEAAEVMSTAEATLRSHFTRLEETLRHAEEDYEKAKAEADAFVLLVQVPVSTSFVLCLRLAIQVVAKAMLVIHPCSG